MRIPVLTAIPHAQFVVGLALLVGMATAFIAQGVPVLYPFIQEDFGTTRAQLGLITTSMLIGGAVTSIPMGRLTDTIGVRRLLGITMMGMAGGLVLFSRIQSPLQGVMVALLISLVASASPPATAKAIMDCVRARTRGIAMGIKETAVPTSGFITAVLLPFLAVTFSWRTAVLFVALMIAILSTVFFFFYRDKITSRTGAPRSSLIGNMAILARNRDIWIVALSRAHFQALHFVFVSYLILFLVEELSMSPAVGASFLAVAWTGSAVGRVIWGLASDLLGGRRVEVVVFVDVLSMLGMISIAWLPSEASPVVVGLLVFVVGSAALGLPGLYDVLEVELVTPDLAGMVIGYIAIITRLGSLVPPIFGLVVDRTHSYDIGWWMMAGIAAVGTLLILFVRHQPMQQ